MFSTIPYYLIGLTALALISALCLIKFWPKSLLPYDIWLKRLEYYRKRYLIERAFTKKLDSLSYSTFFDMGSARRRGMDIYHRITLIRYDELDALRKEYQQYFPNVLRYHPPK